MRLSKPMLLGLRVFAAVARTQSVTRAAGELSVTPGAVSQQLRQIERLLGTELFRRTAGRLALTESGRTLAIQVEAAFHQLTRGVDEVARRSGSGALRVKLAPTLAIHWLVPRLTSFYALHPGIQLELSTYLEAEQGTLDQVDIVVRMGTGHWDDGVAELVFEDESVPICSPGIARRLRRPRDVAKENLLHSLMRPEAWPMWLAAHRIRVGPQLRGTRFPMAALAFQAAQRGLGIALAQRIYLAGDLGASGLVQPFPEPVKTGHGFYLVFDKRRHSEHGIRAFREWVAAQRRVMAPSAA